MPVEGLDVECGVELFADAVGCLGEQGEGAGGAGGELAEVGLCLGALVDSWVNRSRMRAR